MWSRSEGTSAERANARDPSGLHNNGPAGASGCSEHTQNLHVPSHSACRQHGARQESPQPPAVSPAAHVDVGSVPLESTPPPFVPRGVALLLFMAALAQNFSAGCISLFIYGDLAFQPVEATRYWMYVGLTMWFQPLLGWLSDWFVVFGERRRPLFMVSVLSSAIIFLLFSTHDGLTSNHTAFIALSLVNQLFVMGAYIPLNGLLVEVGKRERESSDESGARMGAIMSQAMTIRSIGSFGASLIQTIFLLFVSVRRLLAVTAVLHVIAAVTMFSTSRSLFLQNDEPTGAGHGSETDPLSHSRAVPPETDAAKLCGGATETCKKVKDSFDIHDVHSDGFSFLLVLLFVLFYNAMPDGSTVYFAYLFSEFAFPTWFYAMNNLVGAVGATVGAHLFSVWMAHRSRKQALLAQRQRQEEEEAALAGSEGTAHLEDLRPHSPPPHSRCARLSTSIYVVFVVGSAVWALAYLTNLMLCSGFVTHVLHIPAKVFIPVDNFFVSMCVRFAFMPTIIMAAEHAPHHFEATAFEVFSVASMTGGIFSSLTTSFIAEGMGITREDSSRVWQIILVSIVCKLAPIPFAYFLPERRHPTDAGAQGEGHNPTEPPASRREDHRRGVAAHDSSSSEGEGEDILDDFFTQPYEQSLEGHTSPSIRAGGVDASGGVRSAAAGMDRCSAAMTREDSRVRVPSLEEMIAAAATQAAGGKKEKAKSQSERGPDGALRSQL